VPPVVITKYGAWIFFINIHGINRLDINLNLSLMMLEAAGLDLEF
jgi:hypothetical protein